MGFAGGSGSAAGGGELNNRARNRRGPLHHERPSQSSLPDCRASWKEGRAQGRLREGCEGFDWAHDVRSPAKPRTIHRSGSFPPQDGLFGEGGRGAVGSSPSAESVAFRMNPPLPAEVLHKLVESAAGLGSLRTWLRVLQSGPEALVWEGGSD